MGKTKNLLKDLKDLTVRGGRVAEDLKEILWDFVEEQYIQIIQLELLGDLVEEIYLLDKAENDNYRSIRALVEDPTTSPETFEKLAENKDPIVRRIVAENLNTNIPSDILEKLAKRLAEDKSWFVRAALAENSNLPPDIFRKLAEELAKDPDWRVRAALAENDNTPPDILGKLAEDEYWSVRAEAAENPNTPQDKLRKLVKDSNPLVRAALAENSNISAEDLWQLAKDSYLNVRVAVAGYLSIHFRIPPEMREELAKRLAKDKYWRVRAALAEGSNIPVILWWSARDKDPRVREKAAGNSHTPPQALGELAEDPNPDVRAADARNYNTPPDILYWWSARDKDPRVRLFAALNRSTPLKGRVELTRDRDPDVRNVAMRNIIP